MSWRDADDGYGGVVYIVLGLAVLITVVWSIATIVAAVFPAHAVSPELNAVMGLLVPAAFGLAGALVAAKRRNGNGSGKGGGEPK